MNSEVTVVAYEACAKAGACSAVAQKIDGPTKQCNWPNARRNHPMNCVAFSEAADFCQWIGGRLPASREWEYAAKSGGSTIYPWGEGPLTGRRANFCDRNCPAALSALTREKYEDNAWITRAVDDGYAGTAPVGSYPDGATPWGLLDMAGNVSEWTATKENRGGSWTNVPQALRTSTRFELDPSAWSDTLGFRCAQ
jgi:formylglycine-generating enzyme required for sulfatase activity